ncbi:MAG: hypothetical protein FGM46_02385 [Ferruginibacter sp.]|nr:hypothetical protein [Ferruginibacter sp.]
MKKMPLLWAIVPLLIFLSSCGKIFVVNAPQKNYYFYKNKIEVTGQKLKKSEKLFIQQRLIAQLDDSAKVNVSQRFIILKTINRPVIFDTVFTNLSVKNMIASLYHLGYYHASVFYTIDTIGKKIIVNYNANLSEPTMIDTITYKSTNPDVKEKLILYSKSSILKKNTPITKLAITSELNRIVDSFKNNGYYKFTTSELKVIGDTTNEALISVSDNPFEQQILIAKAQQQTNNPSIKLSITVNPNADSSNLTQYHIRNVNIYPDFKPNDIANDTVRFIHTTSNDQHIFYHKKIINENIFNKLIVIKTGDVFNQTEYFNTIYNLSKTGIWQNVNILISDVMGSPGKIDLFIELSPSKKYGFESAAEVSYSAASNTSNIIAGNLFGLSGNISFKDRNLAKQGIRMIHNVRAGLELNNNSRGINNQLINSNELSYSNNTYFPGLVVPQIPRFFTKSQRNTEETFVSTDFSYNNRFNLFNLRSFNGSFGWTGINKSGWKWAWSPLNIGFSNLFNQSDSFKNILKENPFLRSSYNTALVAGMGIILSKTVTTYNKDNTYSNELFTKLSLEESGITWGTIPLFSKYKRNFIKFGAEVKNNIRYEKSSWAFRGLLGIGIPLLGSDTNRTLPFFKQYFGGGSNSMRGWPVRGIGPGGQELIPFSSTRTIFNDRTGDFQLELNAEYRFDIIQIIPNTLKLKGAVFTDIGNVWNLRNTKTDRNTDTTQISFKNFYRQIGIAAGTGLRFDFNYFIVRFDFGFRFKRPELFYINDGWKLPPIGFNDVLKKLFSRGENDEYRKWRYENFNFSIGIGYPF